ncbi:T9SS type A sorting domain-containing protein [Spirosoma taeanense]|uniref:Aminopeptidase N n=1 Tax=Spirosoma taeanense TaxID=2735870 RepID=A0A6M5Y5S5_9BACT|nr:M1 family aminopeptidase [Spirosoma taeanense]QJW88824.1 T9SS type A sorting domain-containing protein [Spirosoma taeanense]
MRFVYVILLLCPYFTLAQSDDGGQFCQQGKIRFFERLATNPKARLAYPGDATIDVTYYGLDLYLTHTPSYLRGVATIALKSTAENLSSFFLDLNSTTATTGEGLRVDSVKVGAQRLTFQHAQNRLAITLPQTLTNGQALTLTVFYQGVPNSRDLGSFRFSRHEFTTDPSIWSLSEPYGAPDWFPCKDTPADKADSSAVRITAPAQFVSVSNGTLESRTDNPDGTRTYQWRNHYPIAQYLISVALSNYERYDTPFTYAGQTMPVTHYLYPETLPQVKANLDLTPGMLQLFSDRFGPYPFLREKYGHAQFGQGNGGMEHQTISSMEANAFTPAVIAHELAHQWFGDKITCRDWQNIWLNEGFASYAEAVYVESVRSVAGYQTTMNNFMARARNAQGSIYVQDITNFGDIFNSNRSYAKGATVLHMLRGVVGDSLFFRILRTYTATPGLAYGTAVTEDFQNIAQQVSGQNLGYFFRQWIYGEGYPVYRATIQPGMSASTITVQLTQRNSAGSTNPTLFTMPVQLQIQSTAGDTTVTVLNDRPEQTFLLPARGPVTGVIIDPSNRILKTVEAANIVTAVDEQEPTNLRIYPNPATENLRVDFSLDQTGPVTLTLTNLLGQPVRNLTEPLLRAGQYTRTLNLQGVSAGQYILAVETPAGRQNRVVLVP